MQKMMNKKIVSIFAVAMFLMSMLTMAVPVMAAPPTTFTVNYKQANFQWRAYPVSPGPGGPFDAWSYTYQNWETSSDFTLTGKVLHASWSYAPVVTDEEGASTVYTYNKKCDCWIEHEGTVTYKYAPRYGDYTVTNYFRGYVEFDGTPSADSFLHGVAYQWVYIYAPEDDTGVTDILPYAVWDETMDAWLVGFSIYLWDPVTETQSYTIQFPDPFIEPVPASNYNPLDL